MMRQNSLLVQAASCLKISDDGQPLIARRDAPLCCKRRGQRGPFDKLCRGPSVSTAHDDGPNLPAG